MPSVEGNFTVSLTDIYEPSQPNHLVDLNSSVNLEMIWVEPGTFTMGQVGVATPVHNVTLTKGFYLGEHEVTQAQYEAVMAGNANGLSQTPSHWPGNPNRPVEKVSWHDVQVFLGRLNAQEFAAGRLNAGWRYDLPTEAQWEYACRAGTHTVYSWGNTLLPENANWNHGNDANQTVDVGQYPPNSWDFHDMHGNVYEWAADWHATYTSNAQSDPEGPLTGAFRSNRGGSWTFDGTHLPVARRFGNSPTDRFNYVGFRLALKQFSLGSEKLSPALSDLIDGNGSLEQALPAGSVIAHKPGETPPSGYTLFQRNEYNASLVWEERAPVSVGRNAYDGVETINGKIYFAGGWNGASNSDFELYDPTLNSWSSLTPLSVPRSGIANAVLNDKLFLIGGEGYSFVDVFDPVTEQWSNAQALPSVVTKGTAITVAGKIYLLGGQNGNGDKLNQVLEYNPDLNSWSQKANMQYARHGLKAVYFDGRIWVIGGRNISTLDVVESFDIQSNSWRIENSLSSSRDWPAVWVTEDGIFVAGGDNSGTNLNSIEFYDRHSKQWILVGDLPSALRNSGATVVQNKVYLISGTDSTFAYSNKVYAADLPTPAMNLYFKDGNATAEAELSTLGMADGSVTLGQLAPDALAKIGLDHNPATVEGSLLAIPRGQQPPSGYALYKRSDRNGTLVWEDKAPISTGRRAYNGLVKLNGELYLVGGNGGEAVGKGVQKYNPQTNQWTSISLLMQQQRSLVAATSLDGKLLVVGGKVPGTSTHLASTEVFDPVIQQWSIGPELPTPRSGAAIINHEGIVYLMGGYDGSSYSNQVLQLSSLDNQWVTNASMNHSGDGHKLVSFRDEIWAIGGITGPSSPSSKAEIYDPSSDTWSIAPNMTIERHWPVAWSDKERIFVGSGWKQENNEILQSIEMYDPISNTWNAVGQLPDKAYYGEAEVLEGKVYVVGGQLSGSSFTNKVFAADITPPMDLYYREANASGPIELSNLNADLTAKMNAAQSVTLPKGLVSAFKPGVQAPSDYGILERTDRNATHQWEEMAPVSVARYAYDGVEEIDGKLYFVGGRSGTTNFNITRVLRSFCKPMGSACNHAKFKRWCILCIFGR